MGDVQLFGARDYAMRIWLDPDKVAAYKLNAGEVLAALQAQNVQVSAGILNQPPVSGNAAYQLNVQTLGRLTTPEQFADIILKTDAQGRPTRIRDAGHVEIGAADYGSTAFMDRSEGLPLLIFAQPGANSLAVEHEVLATMQDLKKDFPPGVSDIVIYDPTIFVAKSVHEVVTTSLQSRSLLVVGVVFLVPADLACVAHPGDCEFQVSLPRDSLILLSHSARALLYSASFCQTTTEDDFGMQPFITRLRNGIIMEIYRPIKGEYTKPRAARLHEPARGR